jgi:hypothetical protein
VITFAGCVGALEAPLGPEEGAPNRPGSPGSAGSTVDGVNSGDGTSSAGPKSRDPNRPTLRRLNRTEYNNTVRDLLGTTLRPSDSFPTDDVGYGFDNIGDVLSLSPLQLELYQKAARDLSGQLFEQSSAGSAMRARVIACDPVKTGARACAEQSLSALVPRAFRRPVSSEELQRVVKLYAVGAGAADEFQRGMALALEGVLLSANFLFRVELDADPSSAVAHPLSDHELASRLSYFLWSSTPDEALMSAAKAGKLSDPSELRAQVDRMLKDPRSDALTKNFAGQWLLLGGLSEHQTDATKFPTVDAALRESMREESSRFFEAFLRADLPVQELVRADWTFVDARLAKHYGLPAPSAGFARTSVAATERRGILGHASFLTVTSHAATTSPVKRGKWVLERLLCSAPPDPPPGIPSVESVPMPGATLRARFEAHRSNPTCASCHSSMDPIGFSLEPFDAVGALRLKDDGGFAIDARGQLPSGKAFSGARELANIIADDPRFAHCLAEKLFTYALGRGTTRTDEPYLSAIDAELAADGSTLRKLIQLIVLSEPFRMRRGEAGGTP